MFRRPRQRLRASGVIRMCLRPNGSEFPGKVMGRYGCARNIGIDFSRLGKPTDNATVESFNGRRRQECLNENWFFSLVDAREKIEAWRTFYNQVRPHSTLEWFTPSYFARKHAVSRRKQKQLEPNFLTLGGPDTGAGSYVLEGGLTNESSPVMQSSTIQG